METLEEREREIIIIATTRTIDYIRPRFARPDTQIDCILRVSSDLENIHHYITLMTRFDSFANEVRIGLWCALTVTYLMLLAMAITYLLLLSYVIIISIIWVNGCLWWLANSRPASPVASLELKKGLSRVSPLGESRLLLFGVFDLRCGKIKVLHRVSLFTEPVKRIAHFK